MSETKQTTTWIELGAVNLLPGETLRAIEQEGFGVVCAVVDYEGESVFRILRAINGHDDLLEACKAMSACCGPADGWNGETNRCLLLIEAAIAKAQPWPRPNHDHNQQA